MLESAGSAIASHGILGLIVVVLGWAYWQLGLKYDAAMAARTADAQKVVTTLLEMQDKWQQSINELTASVERLNDRSSSANPPARTGR